MRSVEAGLFRLDLFYRINVFPIHLPPLRERVEDIRLIVAQSLKSIAARLVCEAPLLSEEQLRRLEAWRWPGNVRELQNAVERAMIRARHGEPFEFDLPADCADSAAVPPGASANGILTEIQRRSRDRDNILRALRRTGGRVGGPDGAAALLGVRPTTLRSRIKALGIRMPDPVEPPSAG